MRTQDFSLFPQTGLLSSNIRNFSVPVPHFIQNLNVRKVSNALHAEPLNWIFNWNTIVIDLDGVWKIAHFAYCYIRSPNTSYVVYTNPHMWQQD